MKLYAAPMEGVTGYIYRNAHHDCFRGIDKYFSPFIVTSQKGVMKNGDLRDILPENNRNLTLVPQILSNDAKDFLVTAEQIKELGYPVVNLNLGCPSKTVVTKRKGAGFLAELDQLDAFLEEVFSKAELAISVKARLGVEEPEEFYDLIRIFNRYPLEELILHPRIQQDYYKNAPRLKLYGEALALSRNPVCYNGNIFTLKDYRRLLERFPKTDAVMLGRGITANPCLAQEILSQPALEKSQLKEFHDHIYADYREILYGDRNVLFKMKQLWEYMIVMFTSPERYKKKIRKAERLGAYEDAVNRLFEEQELLKGAGMEGGIAETM